MKRITIFTSFMLLLFTQNNIAQIDTNDIYPLHKNNLWEYTNYSDIHYFEVVVDSQTMPNGKTYKKRMSINLIANDISWDTLFTFFRVENESVYIYEVDGIESKIIDTSLPEGSVWINDSSAGLFLGKQISIKEKYYDYMFSDSLTYFFMEEVLIDTS